MRGLVALAGGTGGWLRQLDEGDEVGATPHGGPKAGLCTLDVGENERGGEAAVPAP